MGWEELRALAGAPWGAQHVSQAGVIFFSFLLLLQTLPCAIRPDKADSEADATAANLAGAAGPHLPGVVTKHAASESPVGKTLFLAPAAPTQESCMGFGRPRDGQAEWKIKGWFGWRRKRRWPAVENRRHYGYGTCPPASPAGTACMALSLGVKAGWPSYPRRGRGGRQDSTVLVAKHTHSITAAHCSSKGILPVGSLQKVGSYKRASPICAKRDRCHHVTMFLISISFFVARSLHVLYLQVCDIYRPT